MTDSACSLPAQLAQDSGVTVVPMWVTIGGRQYRDGALSMEEVLARMGEGLSTSCPAPGELARAVSGADAGDGVVVLTISRQMSGAYEAARLAVADPEPGPGPDGCGAREVKGVAVVDTGTAAGAQGLVVLAASRAARAGLPLADVVAAAQAAASRVRLLATLPSLEQLARSGRVPGAAAWGARWLGLNAVFEFRDGRARPLRPARGRRLACQRIVATWARDVGEMCQRGASLHVAALHALDPGAAEAILAAVSAQLEPASAFVGSFSAAMVAHTGPGLAGLAWWWEEPVP